MSSHHHNWQPGLIMLKLLIVCGLLVIVILPLELQQPGIARAASHASKGPGMQVDVGFNEDYREGYWTPVYVTLSNSGSSFHGTLAATVFAGQQRATSASFPSPWNFKRSVALPPGSRQHLTFYVPFYLGNLPPRGVIVTLMDANGQTIATQAVPDANRLYAVQMGELLIGELSGQDPNAGFGLLKSLSLPNQQSSFDVIGLNAATLPTNTAILKNFDVMILANFDTRSLSSQQLMVLQTWVNQGGTLIEVGGADWQHTLAPLPSTLRPVTINSITTLPQGTRLVPVSTPYTLPPQSVVDKSLPVTLPSPVAASMATLSTQNAFSSNEIVWSSTSVDGTPIPLIVKARQGQGTILYLAVDPSLAPLAAWSGTQALWRSLLLYAMGDKFLIPSTVATYYSGPGQILTRGGILSMLQPQSSPGPWIIIILLLGYVVVIGPIRLLIVKRMKHPQLWVWRIFAGSALIFSLLSFGLAYYQKGAALTDNSISLVQLDQGTSSAHITTYMGIYVPYQGDYTLRTPDANLIEPVPNMLLSNSPLNVPGGDEQANFTYNTNSTTMSMPNVGPWTFHPTVMEQDRQLHGGLSAQLMIRKGQLVGTITNTMTTALSDAYVLIPHSFVRIGAIAAGETQRVDLQLHEVAPWEPLTDEIAHSGGLSSPYFPYQQHQYPRNDFERHMALLSALNGAGFTYLPCNGPCNTYTMVNGNTIYVPLGNAQASSMSSTRDSLLAADESATLIGWTEQDLAEMDKVSINNQLPTGFHESFVQMPLSIDFADPKQVPNNFIAGQVVDIQSYNAEISLPGIYSMLKNGGTGGITFEFTLPGKLNFHERSLTINVPDLTAPSGGTTSGPPENINISNLKGRLYNWHTGTWDSISFQQDAFTTTNITTYASSSGEVLMYLTVQDGTGGKIFFSKPTLTLDN
jgi:hypothetical protein